MKYHQSAQVLNSFCVEDLVKVWITNKYQKCGYYWITQYWWILELQNEKLNQMGSELKYTLWYQLIVNKNQKTSKNRRSYGLLNRKSKTNIKDSLKYHSTKFGFGLKLEISVFRCFKFTKWFQITLKCSKMLLRL